MIEQKVKQVYPESYPNGIFLATKGRTVWRICTGTYEDQKSLSKLHDHALDAWTDAWERIKARRKKALRENRAASKAFSC